MVKASPLRRLYYLPSGRLRVEARYDIPRTPLRRLLVEQHGLDEEEVGSFLDIVTCKWLLLMHIRLVHLK